MIRQTKRKFEKDVALKSKSNPKAFWWHIRRRLKTKTGVAPLLENDNDRSSTKFSDSDKGNILQNQFSGAFTHEPEGERPSLGKRTESEISYLNVTAEMVQNEIKNLNMNKFCGPDEIHPLMLIELSSNISKPIAFLFNKTIEYGKTPNHWKKANVSPIFKKGARNRAENYRPISLTSVVCKLMERFIKEAIMNDVTNNKLLSTKQ